MILEVIYESFVRLISIVLLILQLEKTLQNLAQSRQGSNFGLSYISTYARTYNLFMSKQVQ